MATIDLGKIRFNWQGAYNNSTAYVINDVVSSGGNSYICKLASTGNAVSNGTYWDLMSQAGTDGTTVGLGTAGQVLQTNSGASATEWATPSAGGAWTLINTAVASNSASLTITGLNSTYDTYAIALSDIVPSSDGQPVWIRMGDSSGVDSGASDYARCSIKHRAGNTSPAGGGSTGASNIVIDNDPGNVVSGEGMGAIFYLHRPGNGTTYPTITGHATGMNINTDLTQYIFTGARLAVIVLDRVQVLAASGNLASGRMTVWGIAHA